MSLNDYFRSKDYWWTIDPPPPLSVADDKRIGNLQSSVGWLRGTREGGENAIESAQHRSL